MNYWYVYLAYPNKQSHLVTPRAVNEDKGSVDGDRRKDRNSNGGGVNDSTHYSPRSIGVNHSIDIFMKEKEDEKRLKELAYRVDVLCY